MAEKYHDAEYLRRERHEKERSFKDIGEEHGVTNVTIINWFEKLGVPKELEKPYKNEEYLREQYFEKGKTFYEIADENNVSRKPIRYSFDKHGIERRTSGNENWPANFRTVSENSSLSGYETWRTRHNYEDYRVLVHRLLAVAEYGLEETKSKVVHHKNGIRWDNRPENIELMSNSEHTKLHHNQDDLNVKSQE